MPSELLDMYRQASEWTADKVRGAKDLEAATPCTEWKVRDLLNHMLDTSRYFVSSARGQDASPPGPNPPSLLSDDPARDFEKAREELLSTFDDDVIEKTGPALGIALSDQLLHGWDLARATKQDATMPAGLPEAVYDAIHGRFTDEQRKGVFGPEVRVDAAATPQQRLLAYTGRKPD